MDTIPLFKNMGIDAQSLDLQLKNQRRTVDFDTFDIQLQQLLTMLKEGQVWIAPAYQRKFRWKEERCSQLVESVLLGIPVPSLFMATNSDSTWEVVDGLQRLSAFVKFAADDELRKKIIIGNTNALVLVGLKKLTKFQGLTFEELPANIQLHFRTRPMKVVTLNDKSDKVVRFDLFERLNTGGVALSPQEIRDCVYQGKFADKLEELAKTPDFVKAVRLTETQERDATGEECVLRFFAFLDNYQKFDHSVEDFLTDYMKTAFVNFDFDKKEKIFAKTFSQLAEAFPSGIKRPNKRGTILINLYEGVAVGAALALQKTDRIVTKDVAKWISDPDLEKFTTGGTNSRTAVKGRIEFCRDRFLGK